MKKFIGKHYIILSLIVFIVFLPSVAGVVTYMVQQHRKEAAYSSLLVGLDAKKSELESEKNRATELKKLVEAEREAALQAEQKKLAEQKRQQEELQQQAKQAQAKALACDVPFNNSICFKKRTGPTIKAMYVHYGSAETIETLKSQAKILEAKFATSTSDKVKLSVVSFNVFPLPAEGSSPEPAKSLHNYSSLKDKYPYIGPQSYPRIWYHDNMNMAAHNEVVELLKAAAYTAAAASVDVILLSSEAQFEGLGYQASKFVVVEQPSEVAWGTASHWVETQDINALAEEFNHELGHFMGLQHSSPNVYDDKGIISMSKCAESPNKDDIMSYCRNRSAQNKFGACTLSYLETTFVPKLLSGGYGAYQEKACQ